MVYVIEKFQKFSSFRMRENKILSNLYIQFVDVNSIAKEYRMEIDVMKNVYSMNVNKDVQVQYNETFFFVISPKYSKDLFYVGPFYGNCMTNLDRLLVLDVDLEVKEDLG